MGDPCEVNPGSTQFSRKGYMHPKCKGIRSIISDSLGGYFLLSTFKLSQARGLTGGGLDIREVNNRMPPMCSDMCLGGDGGIYVISCYDNTIYRGDVGEFGDPVVLQRFGEDLYNPNSIEYDPILNGFVLTELAKVKNQGSWIVSFVNMSGQRSEMLTEFDMTSSVLVNVRREAGGNFLLAVIF